MVKEVVSACSACLTLRADPPGRFIWPDGTPLTAASLCSWFGDCGMCGCPTKWLMLGTRVVVEVAPEGT